MLGRMLLEDHESRSEDNADDQLINRLRTDLFLDLCIGRELDLLVNEHGQPARSRLVWWIRIDEQWVKII
jgi:hypothetical protein